MLTPPRGRLSPRCTAGQEIPAEATTAFSLHPHSFSNFCAVRASTEEGFLAPISPLARAGLFFLDGRLRPERVVVFLQLLTPAQNG